MSNATTDKPQTEIATTQRETALDFVGTQINTPQELAERIRTMQSRAFVLSPINATAAIAPGYVITPVVVAIDPSVDGESGRGADVYHQRSIHKGHKRGDEYVPDEVSLNKIGLQRILAAAGVNVYPTVWHHDGVKEPYLWVAEASGDLIEFDGKVRRLPPGTGSLDARDNSADIGEWNSAEWKRRVDEIRTSERWQKTPEKDRWKLKPEPIGGWTLDRVLQRRRYGRQLAESFALNRLARNLGVRQSYTIDELKRKPFVIMRPMFQPDMSDPEIRKMVTAANLGARMSLYPGAAPQVPLTLDAPITHAHGEAGQTIPGEIIDHEPESEDRMRTAAAPEDAEEVNFDEPAKPQPSTTAPSIPTYTLLKIRKSKEHYFVETKEGVVLYTADEALARGVVTKAIKDGKPREVETERILIDDKPYRCIVEIAAAGGLKL